MIKYLSLFSGIGAFEKALSNLKIDYELVNFCELDKYAVKSYCAIHNLDESLNLGDITKIDEKTLPKVDFITYGFPCQDISLAGKQQGLFNEDGSKTRSGLFFDALRIIEHCQPKVAIAENVKNLTSKKFNAEFQVVLASLESAGYNNYWAILNSKDYGIPQNRERVFIVSIRKDVDTGLFEFPTPYPLKLKLKDVLEDIVDEKFYFSNKSLDRMNAWKSFQNPLNKVLGTESISPTITTRIALSDGGGINASTKLYSNLLKDEQNLRNNYNDLNIRYYTPKECWFLMGFTQEDFEKAKKAIGILNLTNQQKEGCLYKQAGNSIVVDVAEELLCMLFDEEGYFFI